MENLFVSHLDFDPAKLVKTAVESKKSKPKPDPNNPAAPPTSVSYNECLLMYEYTAQDAKGNPVTVVAPLKIEGPKMFSAQGIQIKPSQNGGDQASIFTTFDLTKPEVAEFVKIGDEKGNGSGCMDKLYRACLQRIFDVRGQVASLARVQRIEGVEGIFGYPIFWKRDPHTSQIVQGQNPSKFWNLVNYGKAGTFTRKETNFCLPIPDEKDPGTKEKPNWKKLDWKLLTSGVEMLFTPLIAFKKIYIGGGKASMQFEIESAVVTHIVKSNSTTGQSKTLESEAQDEDKVKSIRAQVDALTKAFADAMSGLGGGAPAGDKPKEAAPAAGAPAAASAPAPAPAAAPAPAPARLPLPSQGEPQVAQPQQQAYGQQQAPPTPGPSRLQLPVPMAAPVQAGGAWGSLPGVPGLPAASPGLAGMMGGQGPSMGQGPIMALPGGLVR
ncbi:Hypothetical protein POVN_LOCUS449 [uncultured virus]|nr:Hypothetical protein POVN_LOCUS449 [uncultured virus]